METNLWNAVCYVPKNVLSQACHCRRSSRFVWVASRWRVNATWRMRCVPEQNDSTRHLWVLWALAHITWMPGWTIWSQACCSRSNLFQGTFLFFFKNSDFRSKVWLFWLRSGKETKDKTLFIVHVWNTSSMVSMMDTTQWLRRVMTR